MTQELFEIDRRRITCAGGTASIDLMLDLIAQAHGPELAIQVSEQFVLSRIRPRKDHQRMQIATRYGLTAAAISAANKLAAPDRLAVGMQIAIPLSRNTP